MDLRSTQQPLKDRYRADPRTRFEIDAPTASADELASLQTKTERYCTVLQTLTRPPQLETELRRA